MNRVYSYSCVSSGIRHNVQQAWGRSLNAKHMATVCAAIETKHVSMSICLTDKQTTRHYVSNSCCMLYKHSGQKCM